MESFQWGPIFETGLTDVDDQHRKLVEVINRFGTALAENDLADEHVNVVLQELVDYARYHFEDEEKMVTRYVLDARHSDQHLQEHKSFIADVELMCARDSTNESYDGKSLLEFLIHWLAYHILGSDKNMARQIAAINNGLSAEEAYLAEECMVSESTEPLVAALSGLFQQVSKRNRELSSLNQRLETIVQERTQELVKANADLEILALTDALTELPNRRHAMLQLHELWKEAKRRHAPLACMMIDADGFKTVNDTYGHDAGDAVLRRLARALQHSVRSDDIVCRLGGDEFLIICPYTPLDGALYIAEQTRVNISAITVKVGDCPWKGSISVGVAVNTTDVESIDALLKVADNGVYMAKRSGRNCVKSAQVEP